MKQTCNHSERPKTLAEFYAIVRKVRPWPDEDLVIGECLQCNTTISFEFSLTTPAMQRGIDLHKEIETYLKRTKGVDQ